MKLRIGANAKRELAQIVSYIADDKPSAAKKWRDNFYKKCEALKSMPEIGVLREDIRIGLRILPFGNYIILYKIEPETIDIVHIIHGARDWEDILKLVK